MNIFVQELLASRTETTTGNGGAAILGTLGAKLGILRGAGRVRLSLNVSAASGTTPLLDVTISAVENGRTIALQSFTQATTTGDQESLVVDIVPSNVQISWVIAGGTPSFTFSVDAYIEE